MENSLESVAEAKGVKPRLVVSAAQIGINFDSIMGPLAADPVAAPMVQASEQVRAAFFLWNATRTELASAEPKTFGWPASPCAVWVDVSVAT